MEGTPFLFCFLRTKCCVHCHPGVEQVACPRPHPPFLYVRGIVNCVHEQYPPTLGQVWGPCRNLALSLIQAVTLNSGTYSLVETGISDFNLFGPFILNALKP